MVFVGMIPAGKNLQLIRWFQYLLCFARVRIEFKLNNQVGKFDNIARNLHLMSSSFHLSSSNGRVVRVFVSRAVDLGFIPSWVKPMILKLVFTASLLDTQH